MTDLGQATPHAGGPGVPIGLPPGAWPAPTMPPPPGWYWQAVPQERSTLGRRALICALVSIAAPVAALLVIAVAPRASYHSGAQLSVVIARVVVLGLALASPVLAVLGLVFASRGMSRRFAQRGAAIAGLVISIVSLTIALVLTVVIIASTRS